MTENPRTHRTPMLVWILAASAAMLGTSSQVARSQHNPAPRTELDRALARPLETTIEGTGPHALAEFHRQTGIGLVVDDTPRASHVRISVKGSAREGLNALADALDYTWSAAGGGVVLAKRFRTAVEAPQAVVEELRQTAHDALRGLRSLDYAPDDRLWAPMLKQLAASLPPAQAQALRAGRRIDSRDLAPAQRQLLYAAILTRAFGGTRSAWETLAAQLDGIANSTLQLPEQEGTAPGRGKRYACVFALPRQPGVRPLLIGTINGMAPEKSVSDAPPIQASGVPLPGGSADPTASAAEPGHGGHHLVGAMSVGALVRSLAAQTGKQIEVQSCLRDRRVWVALENATAEEALGELAALYDWRWFKSDSGTLVIGRKTPRLPRTPSDVSDYLRQVLPTDFRTFFAIVAPQSAADRAPVDTQGAAPPPADVAAMNFASRAPTLRQECLRTLSGATEIQAALGREQPYVGISASAQEALRLLLTATAIQATDRQIWYDLPGPHRMNALDAQLELQQGQILMVWPRSNGADMAGFGANVTR